MNLLIPGRQPGEKYIKFISNILTSKECLEWIEFSESKNYQAASVLQDGKKNPRRSNDRVIILDIAKSQQLTQSLSQYLPSTWKSNGAVWDLVGCNDRLSFLRYSNDEKYAKHVDVPFEDEARGICSFITCQLYLNEGFKGGETRFDEEAGGSSKTMSELSYLDVVPSMGAAVLFEHELVHQGCAVTTGTKYTVRVDILYKKRC